jgi:threo-3-hydroxy-L-aspartate ammonia-lyase
MITLTDIQTARGRLRGIARHTPLLPSAHYPDVYFKPENLQPIGSFKLRGAFNRIAALPPDERTGGVIAYSSGNHAQAVAWSARHFGIKAVIVMPRDAPAIKIEQTRAYGGEVVLYDPLTEKREEIAAQLMQGERYTLVPPFNDPFVIAGQGTIGAEIYDDLPDVELVLVPIGGGGLISGVATALKTLRPSVKIIGVEPVLADDARQSLQQGRIIEITAAQTARTIADGVRTLAIGAHTFAHMQEYVDGIVTVSEDEIRAAARHLILNEKLVVEPTGALPLAAWLHHRAELPQARRVVLIISGGSVDPAMLGALVAQP